MGVFLSKVPEKDEFCIVRVLQATKIFKNFLPGVTELNNYGRFSQCSLISNNKGHFVLIYFLDKKIRQFNLNEIVKLYDPDYSKILNQYLIDDLSNLVIKFLLIN